MSGWTDAKLAEAQAIEREGERLNRIVLDDGTRNSELYRLARLGLAAEQVGLDAFRDAVIDSEDSLFIGHFQKFLNHPAWGAP